ncbi:B-cell antigen receptor complex-associated protein beta chain [Nibea albiflora]|uniref:B-cell antigen receptor complex-associated protein beta chain n=1 Tax=Nibea albiflora TaxID=240163 RepID=A0ACB7F401_NIBAL|nr:B-cell antigen receptor complex-associated protein beta chain [Nibea albiflora]
MHWLLAGYCALAWINISVALQLQVSQAPRFYVRKVKDDVKFKCWISKPLSIRTKSKVEWYKAAEYNAPTKVQLLTEGNKTDLETELCNNNWTQSGILHIKDVQTEDTGMYFCKIDGTWGPGTHLQVFRPVNRVKAAYRTKMKDGLMILQGLLLAVFIGAILLRKRTLTEKSDSIYEEPETDHIYEGLTIETCGGGLYEELSVYAQADGTEAPWE